MSKKCNECGIDEPRGLMLHQHIWQQIGTHEIFCIACMEKKLGRSIIENDLTDCFGNLLNSEIFGDYQPIIEN